MPRVRFRSRVTSIAWLVVTLAWCVHHSTAVRYGASTIVILGTAKNKRACVGVQIAPQYVLTKASCVRQEGNIVTASFVEPSAWDAGVLEVDFFVFQKWKLVLSDPEAVEGIEFHWWFRFYEHEKMPLPMPYDAAILELKTARIPQRVRPIVLPSGILFPKPDEQYTGDAIITVELGTLTVWVNGRVMYVDNKYCDFPAIDYRSTNNSALCVFPVIGERNQIMIDASNRWSFLVRALPSTHAKAGADWILGFGDSSTRYNDVFRGFSWLSQAMAKWVTAQKYPGVQLYGVV